MKYTCLIVLIFFSLFLFNECSDSDDPGNNIITTVPEIDSIVADDYEIRVGEFPETTIITTYAKGGNLKYIWEVDLGDIIPKSNDGSVVSFTGAACCLGEKEITCTVSNDKGTDSEVIIINLIR